MDGWTNVQTKKKLSTFFFFFCSVHRIWFDQAAIPRTMNKMERNDDVDMNESHTCSKFWWAPHTIIVHFFSVRLLFVSRYVSFFCCSVFFFLIDSTRACVRLFVIFIKCWLILNWNLDSSIEFIQLIKQIPSEYYTNPSNRYKQTHK